MRAVQHREDAGCAAPRLLAVLGSQGSPRDVQVVACSRRKPRIREKKQPRVPARLVAPLWEIERP